MRELLLVGIKQGYPKERNKKNQKCPKWIQKFSNRIKVYPEQKFSAL